MNSENKTVQSKLRTAHRKDSGFLSRFTAGDKNMKCLH